LKCFNKPPACAQFSIRVDISYYAHPRFAFYLAGSLAFKSAPPDSIFDYQSVVNLYLRKLAIAFDCPLNWIAYPRV